MQAGRQHIEAEFDWVKQNQRLAQLYSELLAKHSTEAGNR